MSTKNLLVELFVEELPPKALNKLGEAFSSILFESLKSQGLAEDNSVVTPYASPRRLAVHATNILAVAPDKTSTQKLMPVSVGLDESGNAKLLPPRSANQSLGDLDGVECGPFADIVCDDPHRQAVLHGVILADPAHKGVVFTFGKYRHRV